MRMKGDSTIQNGPMVTDAMVDAALRAYWEDEKREYEEAYARWRAEPLTPSKPGFFSASYEEEDYEAFASINRDRFRLVLRAALTPPGEQSG